MRERSLFGGALREGLRPLKPYRLRMEAGSLIEVPVTTMPVFRVPIHVSYLVWLATFSTVLALQYFKAALMLCRWKGIQPSLLLHPTDFLGCDDVPELAFFPAMNLPSNKKLDLLTRILQLFTSQLTAVTLRQHAKDAAHVSSLPVVEPCFRYSD